MNFYNSGINQDDPLPESAKQALAKFSGAHLGWGRIRRGEERFYGSGLDRVAIGATSPGVLGTLVDTIVSLTLDIAHVLLILTGMYTLWRSIS